MPLDPNHAKYESREVVDFYAAQAELQAPEAYLFTQYLKPGIAVLDMGVGGGRTTPHLAKIAGRYVGADYSQAMVDACKTRFPELEFVWCDATDMSQFKDGSFDALVFSFNGIDVIGDDDARARCLGETARVLKPGGIFIFSSHNARQLAEAPNLRRAKPHQFVWRLARSGAVSARRALQFATSPLTQSGQGYRSDPVHGGMRHYYSTPQTIAPQLARVGLSILETRPSAGPDWASPWIYYASRKGPSDGR
jgi:ubiquinone/menaquinone biosynthesis C-methylase UbiE